jgi:hypothetical protein
MKPQLNELFEWLQSENRNRFEIYNVDTEKAIEKCASYSDLSRNGSTPEEYFTRLMGKGIKTVQIVRKQKHGSTFIRDGCSHDYGLASKDNVAVSGSQAMPGATPQQSNGLGSPASSMNTEIATVNAMLRSQVAKAEAANDRLISENKAVNDKLVSENKELTKSCQVHKDLNTENKYREAALNRPTTTDKVLEGLLANPAALGSVISAFKPGAAALPGLSNPQPGTNLSDLKSTVVDLISNNKQLTDEHVQGAQYVLNEVLKGNDKFIQDYLKLLKEYKLIQA